MSTTCGFARRQLWPDAGPRPATPAVIAARAHLDECEECRRFLLEMRALGEAVRAGAPDDRAPAAVRQRLFTALARARAGFQPPSSRRRARPRFVIAGVIAAAGVLLAAIGGAIVAHFGGRDRVVDPVAILADEHGRAFGETRVSSDQPAVIERWLDGRVPFAVHVPVLPGARLRGARLTLQETRPGAVVEYEVEGVHLSYFIVPDRAATGAPAESPAFDRGTRAGFGVVAWREPGLLHVMIGRLPESRLEHLARICIEQARGIAAAEPGRSHLQEA
ncbi:MAG TPA: hypothetical protein VMM18_04320 [Gemmatimonadaceae bacterium]|nr:hypothetical protein [Gemmatimonadaceae bacterium]